MLDNRKRTELLFLFSSYRAPPSSRNYRKASNNPRPCGREPSSLVLTIEILADSDDENKDSKSKLYLKSKSEQKRRG